jgi:hypothetical protein
LNVGILLLSVKEGGTKLKIALTLQAKNEETAGAEERKSTMFCLE